MTRRSDLMLEDLTECDHEPENAIVDGDLVLVEWRCRCGRVVVPAASSDDAKDEWIDVATRTLKMGLDTSKKLYDAQALAESRGRELTEMRRLAILAVKRTVDYTRDPCAAFEDEAEAFYRVHHMLAPGKSEPIECHHDEGERLKKWNAFRKPIFQAVTDAACALYDLALSSAAPPPSPSLGQRIGAAVDALPATSEEDEKVVDGLMGDATRGLRTRRLPMRCIACGMVDASLVCLSCGAAK